MLAQKQSDQTVIKLVERLKSQGYEVRPNAARRGRSGVDHTFDYLVLRRDGFTNLLAAIEVINDAEDPETSLHRLFAFQDKCTECGISRSVVIAIPRLSFVASQFAQKDGVEVFDEQAIQMFLSRAPSARASAESIPKTFMQKGEVHQSLKVLGYRVDETVRVIGASGTEHVFGAIAIWDDGFVLSRLGIDYLYSDAVDHTEVSLFEDKCRDAGITEKMLLVPKGLTDEARKLAQEKRIEVIGLDGRPREVVPEGLEPLPSPSQRPGLEDAPKPPRAAAPPPVPPPETPDKPGDRKKTIVVSEIKPAAPEGGASPPAGKAGPATPPGTATAPSTATPPGGNVFAPLEPPSRAKQFSMRSVIDQFLSPQVRPKPPDKTPAPVGARTAAAAATEAAAGQASATPAAPDKANGGARLPDSKAAAPGNEATEARPSGETAQAEAAGKPAGAEAQATAARPGPFMAKPVIVPQTKPPDSGTVPAADKPGTPQTKAVEDGKAAAGADSRPANGKPANGKGPMGADSRPANGKPAAGPAQAARTEAAKAEAARTEAPKAAEAKPADDRASGNAPAEEPQKARPAIPGKAGQGNVLPSAARQPVPPKLPAADRDSKQGVVGGPPNGAANAQYLKPTLDKTGIDKRQGLAAKAKLPDKPAEPAKPVVEEVVEKPKVKLSKAARPEALQAIPESTARRFTVLPISVNEGILEVAMVNSSDLATIQVLEMQSKMRIKAVAADQKEILDAIDFNYKGFGQIADQISRIETAADAAQGVDLVASTANAPVAAALNLIVEEAVKARASDIHIEPEEKRLRVRYRIDGVLQEVMSLPIKIHPPLTSRVKVMSDLNIADHLRPQDGQFSLDVKGKGVDVRVATSPTVHGETVVMRILDKSMAVMELPQLGFTEDCLAKYMKMLAVPFGMICVSGPTGAGKTTTLYASLNTMDKVTRNIITAEDPVEYRFEGIKQIQVNPKAGLTFASVLRSMMRLDPDVILVGEIRDAETASIAVKAALTGHTVLCSIHANDAVSVVYRLLDLGVEAFMVASVITGTLAQRMARRVCANCAVETKPTEVEAAAYESVMGEKLESFVSGTGCDLCNFSGYKGRLGIYEVLAMTDTTRAMVLKGATTTELRNQAVKEGMVTLFKDGMQKVKAGKTTVSEVMRNAYSID